MTTLLTRTPWPAEEVARFRDTYFYSHQAIFITEVLRASAQEGLILARIDANARWLVAPHQRVVEGVHPSHVSGADLIMVTTALGSMHAFFFHGCRWDEGWVGFGNRIEHAEFRALTDPAKPLELRSKETKLRTGRARTLIEFEFEFSQDGKPVYLSRQLAMFVKPVAGKA